MEGIQFILGIFSVGAAYLFFRRHTVDFFLFVLLIIAPFFRLFDGYILQNIHLIIAAAGIGGVILGAVLNKLEEYSEFLLKYIIPVALSTIAVHFFLQTYDSAQIKITILETAGPIILMIWLVRRIKLGSFIPPSTRKYAVIPALLFFISGLVSFLFSNFRLETFEPGLLRRIVYIGVFLAVIYEYDREKDFMRIMRWVLASAALITSYGLVQYLGWDWHIWAGAFGQRIFSTFGNPNFLGAWLVLIFPLALIQAIVKKKWYYFLLTALILINAAFTYTMGSWLGIFAAVTVLVILGVLYLVKGNPALLKKIAGGIVLFLFVVTISGIVALSMRRPRSITFRLFTWGASMKMISEPIADFASPLRALLIGHGIESFNLVYPAYRRPEIFHLEGRHNTQTDHAHNEYVEVLFDEGLFGFVVFIWLLVLIYYAGFKRLSLLGVGGEVSINDYYLVAVLSGTLGMLVHAGLDVNPRFVSSGYILWVFLALLIVQSTPFKKKTEKRLKDKKNIIPKYMQIFLVSVLLAAGVRQTLLAHGRFIANMHHNQAIAFSKRRMWDRAVKHYHKVQERHPAFIMAYYFEGNVYNDRLSEAVRKGEREEAEKYYRKAIKTYSDKVRAMYPNYVQLHFQEGMLHMRFGNTQEALKSFRRYLNIVDPVYTPTYFRLGEIYAREGKMEQARLYMEEAVRRKPDEIDTYMNLANLFRVMRNPGGAVDTYLMALDNLDGEDELKQVARGLSELYMALGEKEKAADITEKFGLNQAVE